MADGEGVVEEVLVRGRFDGSEIEKGLPKSVDKGIASAEQSITDFSDKVQLNIDQLVKVGKAYKAQGASIKTLRDEFKKGSVSAEDMRTVFERMGYSAEEINSALDRTSGRVTKVDWSFKSLAKSVQWAAYRFLTTLIIYQAFRKILRSINETISESIRLWKEYTQQQTILKANLEVNQRLLGDQVGTLKEWNQWIDETNRTFGGGQTVWTEAIATLQAYNSELGLSAQQLQNVAIVGASVAQKWVMLKEGQLDIARGAETVIKAIEGQKDALQKLGVTEEEIISWATQEGIAWNKLTEAGQDRVRQAYIMTVAVEDLAEVSRLSAQGTQEWLRATDTAIEQYSVSLGEYAARTELVQKLLALGWRVVSFNIVDALTKQITPSLQQGAVWINVLAQRFPILQGAASAAMSVLRALGIVESETEAKTIDLGEAEEEAAKKTLELARKWSFLQTILQGGKSAIDAITDKLREMVDAVKEAAQPYIDLGNSIKDAITDNLRSAEDAARNFARRIADLARDLARDLAQLERRFQDRAEELVLRAEERKDEIKEDFRKRDAQERDDLNLRLKHMEEDHLLDMKHLREQYEMDIEEAARARDWRAIRTLQRRYGLERRQREEDYQLQRKQFIESWEQRHKQRAKDLEDELKEVEDNLQKQLEALERERQRELEELKIRYQERRAELNLQYAQELDDLRRSLERRLADILTAAIEEGTIRINEATKVTNTLASLYGLDQQNLEEMIRHDTLWLESWASAWESALQRIAAARTTLSNVLPELGPGYGKIPQLEFAKGGTAIATKPTLVKVGEAGPELFTAIPLGKGGSVLGGVRSNMSVSGHFTFDGNQTGLWGPGFEQGVIGVVKDIFKEAFEE